MRLRYRGERTARQALRPERVQPRRPEPDLTFLGGFGFVGCCFGEWAVWGKATFGSSRIEGQRASAAQPQDDGNPYHSKSSQGLGGGGAVSVHLPGSVYLSRERALPTNTFFLSFRVEVLPTNIFLGFANWFYGMGLATHDRAVVDLLQCTLTATKAKSH